MPPPTIIPAPHSTRIQPEFSPSFQKMEMGPTRLAVKTPAFKPIGQSSSSLKKFFPGDEEDTDISSDMSGIADPDLQGHPSQLFTNRPLELHTRPDHPNLPVPSLLTRSVEDNSVDAPSHPRPPSSPLGPSRDSSVTEDLPLLDNILNDETQPRRPSSPALQTPKPPDFEPNDNTGVLTPSNRTRSELYAIVSQVGEGTFGKVYKAQNTVTKLHVALKRIRMESEKEGFPVTAMREIKLLQSLRHENVVRLYEMMVSNGSVYMVFEYMDHDLTGILSQTQFSFTDAHLKSLSHQMLAGLAYLHHKGVIHRDIKGSNILINNRGELKLGDFGLARFYQKRRRTDYTNRVITLWYRPPELLFGATVYGPEVDMWSAGDSTYSKPVFQGNDEIHQLDTIYRVIGTPTTDRWSGVVDLPWYELVKPRDEIPNHFREMFRKWMSPAALDLAERLLCYDPAARATALQAMEAPYFTQEEPPAMAPVG
ncbi:kinase-like domain-containing protein [Mycena sp. CBHHK59/15]|nr:kinase-like domain-containing protein [Mycena sp. CBHHK59/15]